LTDIHHQGFVLGRTSDHGEHGKKPRRRRSSSPEFKAEIVQLCQPGDRSVGQVAKEFDLTEIAVREWVKQVDRDAGTRPVRRWDYSVIRSTCRKQSCCPARPP
jgi:transposase-like protein